MSMAEATEMTQYLTFSLGDELFALDIAKVREVLDYTTVTRVPRMPAYMLGVINLRGTVVPVVDLRSKFGTDVRGNSVNTCIIISEVLVDGKITVLGALADSVQEVVDLDLENIAPAPRIGSRLNTDFIKGIGRQNDRFIVMLDIDRVFSAGDLDTVTDRPGVPV
ncbi:MAG: chemotaxis protein CheW [Nitrospirota bacterium]|nr:chemotaxis protein CheW [Nitrospirota bacterium]